MTDRPNTIDDLLHVEPADPGCLAGVILDQYVELEATGQDPASVYPEWAAHLRSCPACRTDYDGLAEAVRLFSE